MERLDDLRRRVPPHDVEAEECVLGGVLVDPSKIDLLVEVLTPTDFYLQRHQTLFAAMLEIHGQHEPIDSVTVSHILRERGELERIGGASFVSGLSDRVASAAKVGTYARIVRASATQRQLIAAASEIATRAYGPCADVAALVADAEARLLAVGDRERPTSIVTAMDAALAARLRLLNPDVHRVPTGMPTVDRDLGGLLKGTLVVVGGRPGDGKSTLAQAIALHGAIPAGVGVLYRSLEMSREELMLRAVADRMSIPNWKLQRRALSDDEQVKAVVGLTELADVPWFIGDMPAPWARELHSIEHTLRLHPDIGLVIVDHVGLIRGVEGGSPERRHLVIGEITSALVELAHRCRIVVLLVSQLNRAAEKEGREPVLSDLRESGALEQDASVVLFVHVPDRDTSGDEEQSLDLIVAKNRQGPIGRFSLRYLKQFCRITDTGAKRT